MTCKKNQIDTSSLLHAICCTCQSQHHDWFSHLEEPKNRARKLGKCHGLYFVLSDVSMVIHHSTFTSGNSGHTCQNGLSVGKRASVTTAIDRELANCTCKCLRKHTKVMGFKNSVFVFFKGFNFVCQTVVPSA